MSTYTDIRDAVITWTNRPDLAAETDAAIKNAVRAAHRVNTFYKDLKEVPVTDLPTDQLQQIDMSAVAADCRKVFAVRPTGTDLYYTGCSSDDILDDYGLPKVDVYYGLGNYLVVRASAPVSEITITYYKKPTIEPISSLDSWIATEFPDLIIYWAAASVLALIGEQEIKQRVEALARLEAQNLQSDSLSIQGN